MAWVVGLVLYVAGIPTTWWLAGRVEFFRLVCLDEPVRMSVVWPLTWLAAFCTGLLYGTSLVHEWIVGRHPD